MIQISKLGDAQTGNNQDNKKLKLIHQYHSRKRRLSVIGRYGFRAMSPILEKDEDIHNMNKKRHINGANVKGELISASKRKLKKKRCTVQTHMPLNMNKSGLLNPADGKIDSRKQPPQIQKQRKIKCPKNVRRKTSGQHNTNTVSIELPPMQNSGETLNKIDTISISASSKKEKRDVNSAICITRNHLEGSGSDTRKNICKVVKQNISSYCKKKKNCPVTKNKKSYSNTLKRHRKILNTSNYKSDSDNAIARRSQRQQLRKTLSSPPKLSKNKNTSTQKSSPRTNKFKKMGLRRTSNDDEQQKKEMKLLYAKHIFPKTSPANPSVSGGAQVHHQVYKNTIIKKVEPGYSLPIPKHNHINNSNATNNSGQTILQDTCAQNVKSSESCLKQTNSKKSVFSLGSTAHSLSNLHNGEQPTRAKSKINLQYISPKNSEKALNENMCMKTCTINDMNEELTNSFNITLNKNKLIPATKVTEDNILNDIISYSMFENSFSSAENIKMFPPKNSVVNIEHTKQNLHYNVSNTLSHQKNTVKVPKPIQFDGNSKPVINTKTSTPLLIGTKCELSNVPERQRKKNSSSLSMVKCYTHNFKKNNIFPENSSNTAWILPKSFPHDWLDTQDNIQLERKKSMMSCNIEVVPNSNDYEWRSWF